MGAVITQNGIPFKFYATIVPSPLGIGPEREMGRAVGTGDDRAGRTLVKRTCNVNVNSLITYTEEKNKDKAHWGARTWLRWMHQTPRKSTSTTKSIFLTEQRCPRRGS